MEPLIISCKKLNYLYPIFKKCVPKNHICLAESVCETLSMLQKMLSLILDKIQLVALRVKKIITLGTHHKPSREYLDLEE